MRAGRATTKKDHAILEKTGNLMPVSKRPFAMSFAAFSLFSAVPSSFAQEVRVGRYYELETKYLFGFTEGADIGVQGEKEIESETKAGLGMRGGKFRAVEQELAFDNYTSQYWMYEFAVHGLWNQINNVEGLDNRNSANFLGLSWKPKFLIVGRGPGSPIGLSISIEPEWGKIDGTGGGHETSFSMETRLAADTELIPNMLYAAINLIYEPEVSRAPGDANWSRASGFGATAAMAYRVTPKVTLGGEAEYYRAYEGFGCNTLDGSAFYLGPTLHVQFTPKVFLNAAWSTQVAGHAAGEPGNLDLTNFPRQRALLGLHYEF